MDVLVENQSGVEVELASLKALAEHVLETEGRQEEADISIALVGLGDMGRLNQQFRKIERATDVLAFDLGESGELCGEVVISPHVAAEQALQVGISESEEMANLLVHGLLHLLGYSHESEDDSEKMFARQEDLLNQFTSTREAK